MWKERLGEIREEKENEGEQGQSKKAKGVKQERKKEGNHIRKRAGVKRGTVINGIKQRRGSNKEAAKSNIKGGEGSHVR